MRFAYSTINWGTTCDIPSVSQEIRDAGWGAVELFGHSLEWLGTPEALMAKLDGLQPATLFGSITVPTSADALTIHKNRIDYAAQIGASAYGLVGGQRLRWRGPTSAEYDDLARFCEELAVYGARQDVAVSYHPHTGCTIETSPEIDRLMDATEQLQLCLDASHIALVGEDPAEVFDRHWDRLGYIHLKDWAHGKFVELGRGTVGIDFPGLLTQVQERGFNGWIVIEHSRSDISPLESAKVNAAYLAENGFAIQ